MDVFYTYTYSTAAWLAIQGIPLVATPRMITMILMDEARGPSMLEIYFSRCYGLTLLTLSTLTMLLTGSIPLTNTTSPSSVISADPNNDPKTPYAMPTVLVTSCFHAISAFYTYAWYVTTGQVSFALAMVAYGGLASVGLWCLLFGSEGGRVSGRTGADKRTSGWPFGNVEADRKRGREGGNGRGNGRGRGGKGE